MRSASRFHVLAMCSILAGSVLLLAGCEQQPIEVSHPFYVSFIEDPADTALFRCPDGPREGCAIDGLPGPAVFAAGADRRYVTVARHPRQNGQTDLTRTEYFYFARIPDETRGWGDSPEKIIGPLTQHDFDDAKHRLGLPDFSVDPG